MAKWSLLAGVVIAGAMCASAAGAKVYDFSFNASNGDNVFGTFTTNVSNEVISASGNTYLPTLDGASCCGFVNNGFSITGPAGAPYTTPSGRYIVDNDYGVDSYGLYLTTFGGREINIYADTLADGPSGIDPSATIYAGQGPKPAWVGVYDTSNGLDAQEFGALAISAVPEPETWAMMFVGMVLIAGVMRSGRRKESAALKSV
jgi:hypothetical protein